jgi:integrase
MSVRKEVRRRADGSERILYIVDVKVRQPDGEIVRVRKVSPLKTLRAANALEREIRQQFLTGANATASIDDHPEHDAPLPAPTLAEFVPEFMRFQASPAASRRGANKPGELREKQRIFDNHLLPAFGALRLDQITARLIDGYIAARSPPLGAQPSRPRKVGEPLAPSTLTNHLILLRRVLSVAHRWQIIDRIPTFTSASPKRERLDFLTFDEADRLLAAAAPPLRLLLLLAIRTGLRLGELRALRWRDLHLDGGYLRVERSLTKAGFGSPKSGKARTVDLAHDLRDSLRQLAQPPPRPDQLLFAQPTGEPLSEGNVYRSTRAAARAAGIERPIYPHLLRHTFASHCVMRGIPLAVVKEWLGHSESRTTERYAHLAPEVRATFINRLVQPPPPSP